MGVAARGCQNNGRIVTLLVSEPHHACVDCGGKSRHENAMSDPETAVTPPGLPLRLLQSPVGRIVAFVAMLIAFRMVEVRLWAALGLPAGRIAFVDTTPLMEAMTLWPI